MSENQIPKRIFYVWGVGEKKRRDVNTCLLSWKLAMPDYEIIEINEESKEYFDFQKELKENEYFRIVYERKMYACATDYIRLKVLHDNGGIYLDTDVFAIKNFDEFLDLPAFTGIQGNTQDTDFDWVEPAILGAQKGNLFLKEVLDFYHNEILKTPLSMLPEIFMIYLKKLYGIEKFPTKNKQEIINLKDIALFPERYFIPYRFNQEFSFDCIEADTHAVHLWGGSWNNSYTRFFQRNKHQYPIWFLDLIIKIKKIVRFWRCHE